MLAADWTRPSICGAAIAAVMMVGTGEARGEPGIHYAGAYRTQAAPMTYTRAYATPSNTVAYADPQIAVSYRRAYAQPVTDAGTVVVTSPSAGCVESAAYADAYYEPSYDEYGATPVYYYPRRSYYPRHYYSSRGYYYGNRHYYGRGHHDEYRRHFGRNLRRGHGFGSLFRGHSRGHARGHLSFGHHRGRHHRGFSFSHSRGHRGHRSGGFSFRRHR